jgi:glycerophosphoryl diester phosphodiesterase
MNWAFSNRCLVIAHRGDTHFGPENTLPAFEAAIRLGVDGMETDLRLTRDGEIVLFHDDNLTRLAGSPLKIEETDLAELRKIPLGATRIATLEELFDLVGDTVLLNLEIKSSEIFSKRMEEKLLSVLRSFHLKETILVSSFNPLPLWRLKRLAPSLSRGTLFQNRYRLHQAIIPWIQPLSIHAPLGLTSPALIQSTHAAGRRFFTWTVNDENDMKRLIAQGTDGIITDEPGRLLSLLKIPNG